jgi:hypothetical protein
MPQRLMNDYEEITYARLLAVCDPHGVHVFPKVRLADILPIARSGISDEDYRFSLQAHFDFTVCNEDYDALFAVEFDGDFHCDTSQQARDERKNALCERFHLPLLRINSKYINRLYRDFDLLSYIIEVWFQRQVFHDAQASGFVPMDEPFDLGSLVSSPTHTKLFPLSLSQDIIDAIFQLHFQGKVFHPGPSHIVAVDTKGNYRAIVYLVVTPEHVIVAETGMRAQRFPIDESELVIDIALHELDADLNRYLRGEAVAIHRHSLKALTERYQNWQIQKRGGWSWSTALSTDLTDLGPNPFTPGDPRLNNGFAGSVGT